jgi:predicted PurR-regulated permease PerM
MMPSGPVEPASSEVVGPSWLRTWTPRVVVIALVTFVVGAATTWFFLETRSFLVMLLMSIFLAFSLEPAVARLAARGWRRGLATGVVMLGAVLLVVVFLGSMITLLISQGAVVADRIPGWLTSLSGWLRINFDVVIDPETLAAGSDQVVSWLVGSATNAVVVVLGIGSGLIGAVFTSFAVALFVFYLVAEGPKLRQVITRPFTADRRELILAIWDTSLKKTGGYVYSRSLLAVISAVFHIVAFMVIGLPAALAQGFFVGVISQFVPNVGTFIAGALPVIIALTTEPTDVIWVIVVLTVYQQFENLVLANRITAQTMDLHPAVAFASVIVGANLLGAAGALLALPVAATVQAFVSSWLAERRVSHDEVIEPDSAA